MPEATDETERKLQRGDVDVADLIAVPERFGDLGSSAEDMTVEEIAALDPRLRDALPPQEGFRRAGIDPAAKLRDLDDDRRAWVSDIVRFWRTLPRDADRTRSGAHSMHERTPDVYFSMGPVTVRLVRIAMLQTRKERLDSILDFGSAYGRILRAFKASFPEARLTAADI